MRAGTFLVVFCVACGSSSAGGGAGGDGGAPADAGGGDRAATLPGQDAAPSVIVTSDGGATAVRPYNFHVPPGYDPSKPTPLLIMLHGYIAWGSSQEFYLGLAQVSDAKGFLYAYPDGMVDATGAHFWNATDACCNFYGSTVDDVAYIDAIIEDVARHYNLDRDRVFLFGHSNGAFMSHRTACDLSPKIAAIAALAGDDWLDWSKCNPTTPVSVMQLHGDSDAIIYYGGGRAYPTAGDYPSAAGSAASWAHFNGCPGRLSSKGFVDLDAFIPGAETEMQAYPSCANGAEVALWTIHGGGHVPGFKTEAMTVVWSWLADHPKVH